jgi:large subunit ribosomal protein L29
MKYKEIKEMTLEDVKVKAEELNKEIFALRMRNVTSQLENPLKIRSTRRDIARLKTAITEKQREQERATENG